MALVTLKNDRAFDENRRKRLESDEARFFANKSAKELGDLITKTIQAYDPEGIAGVAIVAMLDHKDRLDEYFDDENFSREIQYCPANMLDLEADSDKLDSAKYRQFNYGDRASDAVLQMRQYDVAAGSSRRDRDLAKQKGHYNNKIKFLSFIDEYTADEAENVVWQFCISVVYPYLRESAMLLDRLDTVIRAHFIDVMYVIEDTLP